MGNTNIILFFSKGRITFFVAGRFFILLKKSSIIGSSLSLSFFNVSGGISKDVSSFSVTMNFEPKNAHSAILTSGFKFMSLSFEHTEKNIYRFLIGYEVK